MKKAIVLFSFIVILSSSALAQKIPTGGIQWKKSVADAQEEATRRNVPIFVSLHQQNSYTQMGSLFREENKKFADFINNNCVALVGLVEKYEKNAHFEAMGGKMATHASLKAKDPYDKKTKDMCTLFYGIACEEHEKVLNEMGKKLGMKKVPANFILGPDLSVLQDLNNQDSQSQGGGSGIGLDLGGGGPTIDEHTIEDAITQAQKSLGTGLSGADWQKVKKLQKQADEAMEKTNYREAITRMNSIKALDKKLSDNYSQFVDGKLGEINSKGEELLDKALGNENPKVKEAAIKDVMDKFKGLDVEKKAKEELDKLKENK